MQLVKHDLVPRPAGPALGPVIGVGIDHFTGTVHVLWLIAGGGIGDLQPVGKLIAIERSGADTVDEHVVKSSWLLLHWDGASIHLKEQCHAVAARRPEPEADAVRLQPGARAQMLGRVAHCPETNSNIRKERPVTP